MIAKRLQALCAHAANVLACNPLHTHRIGRIDKQLQDRQNILDARTLEKGVVLFNGEKAHLVFFPFLKAIQPFKSGGKVGDIAVRARHNAKLAGALRTMRADVFIDLRRLFAQVVKAATDNLFPVPFAMRIQGGGRILPDQSRIGVFQIPKRSVCQRFRGAVIFFERVHGGGKFRLKVG